MKKYNKVLKIYVKVIPSRIEEFKSEKISDYLSSVVASVEVEAK
jgi:hypothetical protein